MDVNLLKALLWAQTQRSRNPQSRLHRAAPWLMTPLLLLATVLGWTFAQNLSQIAPGPVGSRLAGSLFTLAFLAAIWDGTPALDPTPLRPFQVRPGSLFLAELLLSLLTPFRRAQAALLLAFTLGASAAGPSLLLWMLPVNACLLVALICLERLLGRLTRQVGHSLRQAVVFAALLLPLRHLGSEVSELLMHKPLFQEALALPALAGPAWLPTTTALGAWQGGAPLEVRILVGLLWPLLATLTLAGFTFLALRRELETGATVIESPTHDLWHFRKPWAGVARQRWASLWASKQGRFFLFAPLLVPLLQVDAMIVQQRPGPAYLIGCVGWTLLPLGGLATSLFGLDRAALRTFWTWPLEDRDLLLGKLVGTGAYQVVVILLGLSVLPLLTPMPARLLPAALLFCLALACFQLRVGLRLSIEYPRPLDPAGLNPGGLDDAHFIRIGNLLLPWALLVLAWILGACLGEGALLALMAAVLLLAATLLAQALPDACQRLDRHRDALTAALERVTPA